MTLFCLFFLLALPGAARADYVRIKGSVVNVRQGPGTSHSVLFQAEKGEEFDLVSTEGLWCLIKVMPDQEAWVFRNLVEVLPGDRPGAVVEEERPEEGDRPPTALSWILRIGMLLTAILVAALFILKRREILHGAGRKLKEISGYRREHAFRYDNRKPSDDSWEL